MPITRRHLLALAGSGIIPQLLADSPPAFDVDRLTASGGKPGCSQEVRKYTASATVMLFSIPLVSKASVGSGYAVVEQSDKTLSIQFGAGSYPDSARGLNRLGFIQEAVVEEEPGKPAECAWLAFMTTSQEKSLEQARKSVEKPADASAVVPYSASQGYGRMGSFRSRVDRLEFPSKYTWRDIARLVEAARGSMHALKGDEQGAGAGDRTATFLYLVRRALLDPQTRTSACLVFNGKQFTLDTEKEPVPSASVTRLNAVLTEKKTGIRTPFRIWFEPGQGSLPLRFEYQAKSFLRLTFEADPAASAPPIRFAFKNLRENA
jgi:hypothetical protein